ncbi:serine/threonine protein kinase [Variovorax sp. LT1R20]|uniref:serine/threonine protein kinase n=1 Tax=Variovorax sp. LT1R20 TaxID=3443729 RepID=UPI003F477860
MKQQHSIFRTTVMAALLGVAGAAIAQTTSIPAQPDPAVGGQASTMTPAGVANPTQRPDNSMPASREAVKAEARVQNRNNANSMVPKGEATTTINHQPNAMPQPTGEMSRAEVSQQARKVKPRFGEKGERPAVPTNPTEKTGTPQ